MQLSRAALSGLALAMLATVNKVSAQGFVPTPGATLYPGCPAPPQLNVTNPVTNCPGQCTEDSWYYLALPDNLWPAQSLTLGSQTYNVAQLKALLQESTPEIAPMDQSLALAFTLIPTLENLAAGTSTANSDVLREIAIAQAFLTTYPIGDYPANAVYNCTQKTLETNQKYLFYYNCGALVGSPGACPGVTCMAPHGTPVIPGYQTGVCPTVVPTTAPITTLPATTPATTAATTAPSTGPIVIGTTKPATTAATTAATTPATTAATTAATTPATTAATTPATTIATTAATTPATTKPATFAPTTPATTAPSTGPIVIGTTAPATTAPATTAATTMPSTGAFVATTAPATTAAATTAPATQCPGIAQCGLAPCGSQGIYYTVGGAYTCQNGMLVPSTPTTAPSSGGFSSNGTAQCPGPLFAAPTGPTNYATNQLINGTNSIPSGAYVNMNGTATSPATFPGLQTNCNGVALQCPVQYDAPQSHGAGVQDNICYVYDPYRSEAPWAGSNLAYPQCYNPVEHVCTATNFLCPVGAPLACGNACFNAANYQCVVGSNPFSSYLIPVGGNPAVPATGALNVSTPVPPTTKPVSSSTGMAMPITTKPATTAAATTVPAVASSTGMVYPTSSPIYVNVTAKAKSMFKKLF